MSESTSCEEYHAFDPVLDAILREHPDAYQLRAAWLGVCRFIEDTPMPAMRRADAAALLLAKALDACGLEDDARCIAALAPSAKPLQGRLPFRDLSSTTLCALAVGVLRVVPESSLAPGAAIALDPERLRGGLEWELDFAAMPALCGLMRDAVRILDAQPRPGLILARSRCAMTRSPQAARERKAMLNETFAQLAAGRAHRFVWID